MKLAATVVLILICMVGRASGEDSYEAAVRDLVKTEDMLTALRAKLSNDIDSDKSEMGDSLRKNRQMVMMAWDTVITEDYVVAVATPIYRQTLKIDDLGSAIQFYRSDAGKKILTRQPPIDSGIEVKCRESLGIALKRFSEAIEQGAQKVQK